MTIASGSRHQVAYIAESTYGVTPVTPNLQIARALAGVTLGLTKQTFASEELRSDRMPSDVKHGTRQVGGAIPFELSDNSWDDFLQAVLCGTWASPPALTGTTISASSVDNSVNDSANGFLTAGFEPGTLLNIAGFTGSAGNNQTGLKIVSVTAGKMVLSGGTALVTDAAGESVTLTSQASALKAGSVRRSFTIERFFQDLAQHMVYTGVEVNKMSLTVNASGIVKGSFDVIGQAQSQAAISGATYTNPLTSTPYDGFSGSLLEAGVLNSVITEIQFSLDNGMSAMFVVGSPNSLEPSIGRSKVEGTITAYFQDATLVNKFINETESSMEFTLGGNGSGVKFKFPRIKYNGGSSPQVQNEGPVTLSLPFVTLYDSGIQSHVQIWRNV